MITHNGITLYLPKRNSTHKRIIRQQVTDQKKYVIRRFHLFRIAAYIETTFALINLMRNK